ncbi:sodium transport system permease protein [Tumebacillus sp. BK434]|uniref:ABC transporter permease n=1 Tax=Tumebacillus sp. BK434 TaxID=2512169 RepID=UPI00104C0BB6|nr:ABC transporter permease [Tumebacillus sp. BK434]TCP52116.1 sodium transport system permease protein [Tumebacillus sp. BK434]
MKFAQVWIVLQKEITDLLRDRKTWLTSVLLPLLLIPALMILIVKMQVGTEEDARSHIPIAVIGQQAEVEQAITAYEGIEVMKPTDPKQALTDGEIRAIVEIDEDFAKKVESKQPANVNILYNPADQKSAIAQDVLKGLLDGLEQQMMAKRLAELNLSAEAVQPLHVAGVDVSTDDQKAGSFLGFIVPLLLIVSCVTGAMPAATDLIAGEKERGTLEALLTTPVNGTAILTGKLITTSLMAFVSAIASTMAMMIAAKIMPSVLGTEAEGGLELSLSFLTAGNVVLLLVMLLGLAVMFASLMLCVSSLAKSFKEAQTYLAPFMVVAMVPVYATMFMSPQDAPTVYYFLPVINATMMVKELLYGIINWTHIGFVLGSILVYAGIAVVLASKLFRREGLIVKG